MQSMRAAGSMPSRTRAPEGGVRQALHVHTTDPLDRAPSRAVANEQPRPRFTPLIHDAGAGYDVFGANGDWARRVAIASSLLYDHWFRVRAYGTHHIPQHGAGILVANHSGNLPLDATMIWTDILRRTDPPRLVRPVAHHVVPALPLIGTLAARMGVVGGTRTNVKNLLSSGELLLIFPEGVPGILKGFRKRYQLCDFTVGHVEFALRHRVPIYPIAVIGAEEQLPAIGTIPFGRSRIDRVPVPLLPFPLPVRYHLHYGAPLALHEDHGPECADMPDVLESCARRTRDVVQALVREGLGQRKGVFT